MSAPLRALGVLLTSALVGLGCGDDEGGRDGAVADAAGGCRAQAEVDCARACDRLAAAAACSGAVAGDRQSCLADCAQAALTPSPVPWGCVQDFTDCASLRTCAEQCRSHLGLTCDPANRQPCLEHELCDARSRTCIAAPRCQRDSDCQGGYSCTAFDNGLACYSSCSDGRGLPADELCQASHACDESSFQCVPWQCISSAAGVDCQKGCAALAVGCELGARCNPTACANQASCLADCEAARASGDPRRIASVGCLQQGHDCRSFGNCEAVCAPDLPDAGAPD
ncbi:MAG: hypothetical protein IT370_05020 [Deltaproteobacteria bacterium]|nr:hypothetical protein [Deltaproteobacteria bacterium]